MEEKYIELLLSNDIEAKILGMKLLINDKISSKDPDMFISIISKFKSTYPPTSITDYPEYEKSLNEIMKVNDLLPQSLLDRIERLSIVLSNVCNELNYLKIKLINFSDSSTYNANELGKLRDRPTLYPY